MIALLDTGSDITAIRQDVYEAYFKDIDLNGESVTLRAQVDVVFRDGEIVVSKKERHNFLWTITLDEEANKETEIVDVIHIKNEENRKEVKKLIEEYHPEKIMDADVEMKIILKNEESIYQSPRRLAITEKEERSVSTIFRKLLVENIMLYYMDDIVILSSTEEEGLERLKRVFQVAKDYGLDIKKKKCQLLKTKIEFLGFIIDDGRVQPSNDKTLAIKNHPQPTTLKQIQSFLGLTGYFRKFISSYSVIAKPLSDLLRKERRFVFGYEQKEAFEKLKKFLSCKPVLHIYKQGGETELHTDASKYGYGACLLQKSNEDGRFHPVYYNGKKTTPAEEKYSSYELVVLAIIQAVKKFRIYLLGIHFKIITDCSAFQKTTAKKDLTTRVAGWALLLEEYSYEIEHRKGNKMSHVDALSLHPNVMTLTLTKEDGVVERLRRAQELDEHILAIKKILSTEDYEDFFVKSDILYKFVNGRELIVVPKMMQTDIIKKAHEIGHFALPKTGEVVNREFLIPKLKEKIQKCLGNCIHCILGNRKEEKKEGMLHPIPKQEGPLHTYHVDHLGPMPSTNKNYHYILAIVDDFSKFTWLYACKSTTTKEVIDCLEKQKQVFGNPSRIITDRGTAFTAEEFKNYCIDEGIQNLTITTGVPRGNGQVERVNRIIIPVLTKLSLEDPGRWFKYVERVQRALNSTIQRSIGTSPFETLTGVKMRNKEEVLIKELLEEATKQKFNENREDLRAESNKQILKVQEENRRKPRIYKKGDLVAIKRTQFGVGSKIQRKFLGPYEVTKMKPNDRYDVVKVGHHEGPVRTSTCAELMKPWVDNQSESGSDSEQDGRV
ncbi:hypothetical protein JTB14_028806 [Gonioctena quinquepunctata]|nr:hypothetical protein JTB14_028806 [Gonioctena quinquepunctata]